MNTKQYLTIVSLIACVSVSACTKTAKSAEKAPTPVKIEAVESYTASGGARYSASIIPGSQVELSFNVGGFVDRIAQVKGVDGHLRNVQQGDSVARGLVLANVRTKDY